MAGMRSVLALTVNVGAVRPICVLSILSGKPLEDRALRRELKRPGMRPAASMFADKSSAFSAVWRLGTLWTLFCSTGLADSRPRRWEQQQQFLGFDRAAAFLPSPPATSPGRAAGSPGPARGIFLKTIFLPDPDLNLHFAHNADLTQKDLQLPAFREPPPPQGLRQGSCRSGRRLGSTQVGREGSWAPR